MVETFVAVFPHAVLLQPFPILIGSGEPIPFDHARLLARLADPAVLAHARRGNPGIEGLAEMVSGPAYLWTPATARGPAPLKMTRPSAAERTTSPVLPPSHNPLLLVSLKFCSTVPPAGQAKATPSSIPVPPAVAAAAAGGAGGGSGVAVIEGAAVVGTTAGAGTTAVPRGSAAAISP